jgi:sterol desaturase/sphingolipid hydroxylase (fatty acid hydroxylase superfamily)
VSETDLRTARLVGFAAAFVLALALQRLLPHRRLQGSWRVNGGVWLFGAVVMGVLCGACVCLAARWAEPRSIGLFNSIAVPAGVRIIATVLLLDAVSWAWHRANHLVPFLWRFHRVHHSDGTFTVSTALRFHPGELLLSLPVRLVAVLALGAPVVGVVVFEVVFAFSNLIEHGNVSLPLGPERVLSAVLITPALHRHHHSVETAELNSNVGTIFTFWDRAMGSFQASSSADSVATGLPGGRTVGSVREALILPVDRL